MTDALEAAEVKEKAPRAKALKQYMVTFHEGESGDKSDIQIVHNYVVNSYKRGVPCKIDENFLAVLRDAKLETTRTFKDPQSGANVEEKTSRPAIQFSVDVIG